ncbi:MAG: hypothetical protein HQL43_04160 [Alphaproteobacteria bacterium]|nr:hypothetical protein [Alphaproteobacteria bacterium]
MHKLNQRTILAVLLLGLAVSPTSQAADIGDFFGGKPKSEKGAAQVAGTPKTGTDPQSTRPVGPQATLSPAQIEGFRSARFGYAESELRAAMRKDLGVSDKDIVAASNDTERTSSLTAKANNLLPDSGMATVSYILGARAKKLIQVNVLWGGVEPGAANLATLVGLSNSLRGYFLEQGSYVKETLLANQPLDDGTVLVFRGADDKGRMVLLRLVPEPKKERDKNAPKDAREAHGMLLLSYIENPKNPDVFRIEKGQF